MKKLLLLTVALVLALGVCARAEIEPIEYRGSMSGFGSYLSENLFRSDERYWGAERLWLYEPWDSRIDDLQQFQMSCYDPEDAETDNPVGSELFALAREKATELLGEPICSHGDGRVIDLILSPLEDGEEKLPVMISDSVEEDSEHGVSATTTTEVLDRCVYLFYIQKQPAVLHLAYLRHTGASESEMTRPRDYDSVDFRFTAIDEDQVATVLAQAASDRPVWQPSARTGDDLEHVVYRNPGGH